MFSIPLRARASSNFDKACKWRAYILYCKNQWKINIFRFLCFLHFCLRNWFPWNVPSFFPCKIFEFLEGAICLFWINFWCYFGWFWLQFGIQDPSGGLPGGTSKKHPLLIPILIDFWLFWSLPGAQNRWKTTWMQLCGGPILAPKADCWQNAAPGCDFGAFGL